MQAIRTSIDGPFADAVERVKAVFKERGFGTLSEIDVQEALREKIGVEIEPYVILGVCNPQIASRAIAIEHEIGVFLPCTVLMHECGGRVNVTAQDPLQLVASTGNPALDSIGEEAHQSVSEAIDALR